MSESLACNTCKKSYPITRLHYACDCGGLLEVVRDANHPVLTKETIDARRANARGVDASGVWAFRERVLDIPETEIVTHPEGRTKLYARDALTVWAGAKHVWFKHEGENPSGSFKDRGMTAAVTQAKRLGAKMLGCASTGNTSSSLASYAAQAGLRAVVFLPDGKVSSGKLAQTVAYGATCLAIRGDFDVALELVQKAAETAGVYLVNSVNPFRIEGQKTIVWELLHDFDWNPPDWIVVPAGNLGNTSAFGKALREARAMGWIDRVPRILSVQAEGASPFYESFQGNFKTRHKMRAETVATAIRIGDPVNYERAKVSIAETNGLVERVTDAELLDAKRQIDRAGIGCEPASACTLAAVKKLIASGTMNANDRIACVLTGHILKDPDVLLAAGDTSASIIQVDPSIDAVRAALSRLG